jgi:hypothetical protein
MNNKLIKLYKNGMSPLDISILSWQKVADGGTYVFDDCTLCYHYNILENLHHKINNSFYGCEGHCPAYHICSSEETGTSLFKKFLNAKNYGTKEEMKQAAQNIIDALKALKKTFDVTKDF